MPIIVGGYLLEPAPFLELSKEIIVAGNQTKLGSTYKLNIQGKLVAFKGSPQGGSLSGPGWDGYQNLWWTQSAPAPDETIPQFHKLYSIERKITALEHLFAQNGTTIEWESPDGSQPLKAQFKNANIQIQPGNWAQTADYTITAECDLLYLIGQPVMDTPYSGLIQNASEAWNIDIGEVVKTFSVSHHLSAVGKIAFDTFGNVTQPAWQTARDFVLSNLTLGISGVSQFSPTAGGKIFSTSMLSSGVLNLAGYTPYNYSLTESVDELAGSCDITETFLLSPTSSGSNVYTVSTRRIVEDPYATRISQINGTIHGYYDGLFNYDQRIQAADYFWHNTLAGPTGLWYLVSSVDSGVKYNVQPRQGSLDYDVNAGTLSYQYEFTNQMFEGDSFEQWQISQKTSISDYITTFSIAGTIKGRRYDGDTDVSGSFARAYTQWVGITGSNYVALYNRVLSSSYFPEASLMGIQSNPVSKSVDFNEAEGLINYSVEYNNRRNENDYWDNLVQETYQINKHFTLDDGITTFSINGEIQGLSVTDINSQQSKFANASGYYSYITAGSGLYLRIQKYYGVSLPFPVPFANEVGYFPIAGNVTYSQEYKNIFGPMLASALSEHITVTDTNFNKNINQTAVIDIPGRGQGPIIQDVATTPVQSRTVSIEAVFPPTGSFTSLLEAYNTRPIGYDTMVLQLKPANSYCKNFTPQWDWRYGRFSLNVEWIYT